MERGVEFLAIWIHEMASWNAVTNAESHQIAHWNSCHNRQKHLLLTSAGQKAERLAVRIVIVGTPSR